MKKVLFLVLVTIILVGCTDPVNNSPVNNSALQREEAEQEKGLEVVDSKWKRDNHDILYVVGTVRNNSSRNYGYAHVEINLYDKAGAQVGSTLANISNLEPHGTWKFKAIVMDENNVHRYDIKSVKGF